MVRIIRSLCGKANLIVILRLISASVGTVVYYGFQGHDTARNNFLMLCLVMGVLGSILPFMEWFNDIKYRVCRSYLSMNVLAEHESM